MILKFRQLVVVSAMSVALVAIAFSQTIHAAIELPATDCVVQPYRVVDLGSPVAGVIEKVLVERSDYVEIGQEVARINDRIEIATVELAKARTKVEAQLQAETINVAFDVKSQKRVDSLYGRQVIPIENKDAADRDVELSRWRLEQVKDLRVVRNLELERAKQLVAQKVIRSPLNGFVLTRFKSQGEFIEDQPIMRIAQLDPLNIEAMLPMKYFGMIKPGMRAEVKPEVVTSEKREARVVVVDRVGDAAAGTFGVRLEMSNPDYQIPAGLKCEVKFMATSDSDLVEFQHQRTKKLSEAAEVQFDQEVEPVNSKDLAKRGLARRALPAVTASQNSLGPFYSRSELETARQTLAGPSGIEREETVLSTINYIVLSMPGDKAELESVIESLKLADFEYIWRGHYKGRFSLGVYNLEVANTRSKQLAQLGLKTEVSPRFRERKQWWLDFTSAEIVEKNPDQKDPKNINRLAKPVEPATPYLVQLETNLP